MKKWNFIEIKLTLTKLKCERKQEKGKIKRKSENLTQTLKR
jgi:hypothetical protein